MRPPTRILRAGLAAALLLAALAPSSIAFREPFHDFQSLAGPTSVDLKYAVYGEDVCIVEPGAPPGTELLCTGPFTSPSGIALLPGHATFGLHHYNDPTGGPGKPHMVRVWVEHASGLRTPDPTYGFSVTVCADRDDDGTCTNLDPAPSGDHPLHPWYDDQYKSQYSNPPIEGEPCKRYSGEQGVPPGPEKRSDPGKDSKDCGDPTDAEVWMCVLPDVKGEEPGHFDDLWVFVSEWQDDRLVQNHKDNTGAGVSAGVYDIYVEYFPEFSCEPWD